MFYPILLEICHFIQPYEISSFFYSNSLDLGGIFPLPFPVAATNDRTSFPCIQKLFKYSLFLLEILDLIFRRIQILNPHCSLICLLRND